MKCKVKVNYLEVNGQNWERLTLLLFLLSKLVAIPRKKLESPWKHDDGYICTHQKNQFKLDISWENGRFSSLFAAEDVSRGITSVTPRQKFRTDDVKLFTNERQKTKGNSGYRKRASS